MTRIALIAAMDRRRLIGAGNALPWRLPADMARFRRLTMGKPVIMGRRTHESIGRPLPGRLNIVLSRRPGFEAPGCVVAADLEAALAGCGRCEEAVVIGGARVYEAALPRARRMYLTFIDHAFEGDTYFPAYAPDAWREVACERRPADERNAYELRLCTFERS